MIFVAVCPHMSSSCKGLANVLCSRLVRGMMAFLRDLSTAESTLMHSPTHSEYLRLSEAEAEAEADPDPDPDSMKSELVGVGMGLSIEIIPAVQRWSTRVMACKRIRRLPSPSRLVAGHTSEVYSQRVNCCQNSERRSHRHIGACDAHSIKHTSQQSTNQTDDSLHLPRHPWPDPTLNRPANGFPCPAAPWS